MLRNWPPPSLTTKLNPIARGAGGLKSLLKLTKADHLRTKSCWILTKELNLAQQFTDVKNVDERNLKLANQITIVAFECINKIRSLCGHNLLNWLRFLLFCCCIYVQIRTDFFGSKKIYPQFVLAYNCFWIHITLKLFCFCFSCCSCY